MDCPSRVIRRRLVLLKVSENDDKNEHECGGTGGVVVRHDDAVDVGVVVGDTAVYVVGRWKGIIEYGSTERRAEGERLGKGDGSE